MLPALVAAQIHRVAVGSESGFDAPNQTAPTESALDYTNIHSPCKNADVSNIENMCSLSIK